MKSFKKYIKEVLITENAQEFIAKFYPIIEEYYKEQEENTIQNF